MAYLGRGPQFINPSVYTNIGDGSITTYSLGWNPGSVNTLIVFLDGVHQKPGTDYTISAGNIIFFPAPALNVSIVVYGVGVAGTINTVADGSITASKIPDNSILTSKLEDDGLVSLGSQSIVADRLLYGSGIKTFSMITFDAAARTLLTDKKFTNDVTFESKYLEKVNARGSISGAQTIDHSLGTYVTATLTGATTFTFTNPPASGYMGGFMFEIVNGGTFPTWPASVKWSGGIAPTLTTTGIDVLVFTTANNGTTWFGNLVQKDVK